MSGLRCSSWVSACAAIVVVASCLSGCAVVGSIAGKAAEAASDPPVTSQVDFQAGKNMIGYWAPGFPLNASPFRQLERQTRVQADIGAWFVSMPSVFDPDEARTLSARGVLPLLELGSGTIPLTQIVAGRWNAYLNSYAHAVETYSSPVAIDFDHDFNEPWTEWGYKHTSAATFVAAWRHIEEIFWADGATNVIWVWDPGVSGPGTVPIRDWYPGNAYVRWVGLNGYFTRPAATFQSVFGPTLRQVSEFTNKNVLITETAANPGSARVTQINSLFTGVAQTAQIIGLIWFAADQQEDHDGLLQGDSAALSAFRADWQRDESR